MAGLTAMSGFLIIWRRGLCQWVLPCEWLSMCVAYIRAAFVMYVCCHVKFACVRGIVVKKRKSDQCAIRYLTISLKKVPRLFFKSAPAFVAVAVP